MKAGLTKGTSLTWLLIVVIACGAGLVLWKVIVLDAPPANSLLITAQADESFSALAITPTAKTAPGKGTRPTPTPARPAQVLPTAEPSGIQVYITGAVQRPGVYTLRAGARVADALQAAGGVTTEADLEAMNLAQRVTDEEQISIPARSAQPVDQPPESTPPAESTPAATPPIQTTPPAGTPATATPQRSTPTPKKATPTAKPPAASQGKTPTSASPLRVNINTATEQELEQLPGIGPTLAGRIIEYRQQHGPFSTVEDLMQVSGIKSGIMGRVRPYVTVGP